MARPTVPEEEGEGDVSAFRAPQNFEVLLKALKKNPDSRPCIYDIIACAEPDRYADYVEEIEEIEEIEKDGVDLLSMQFLEIIQGMYTIRGIRQGKVHELPADFPYYTYFNVDGMLVLSSSRTREYYKT
jgi:hypothetical protein